MSIVVCFFFGLNPMSLKDRATNQPINELQRVETKSSTRLPGWMMIYILFSREMVSEKRSKTFFKYPLEVYTPYKSIFPNQLRKRIHDPRLVKAPGLLNVLWPVIPSGLSFIWFKWGCHGGCWCHLKSISSWENHWGQKHSLNSGPLSLWGHQMILQGFRRLTHFTT